MNSIKILTTCKAFGGSEMSTIMLQQMFVDAGYKVELYPFEGFIRDDYLCHIPDKVIIKKGMDKSITEPCDVFLFYTSDTVYNPIFNSKAFETVVSSLQATKKIMVLNYHLGFISKLSWHQKFDLYMFLNEGRLNEFKTFHPNGKMVALAPPVNLDDFYKVEVNYKDGIRMSRINSQGDAKYPDEFNLILPRVLNCREDLELYFMPPKSDLIEHNRIHSFAKNTFTAVEFLKQSNCFWYLLPQGYEEQGPRVIIEAQACGLPVIASNQSGLMYRVNNENGWLINNPFEIVDILQSLTPDILEAKGKKAREWAYSNYNPKQWYYSIKNLT